MAFLLKVRSLFLAGLLSILLLAAMQEAVQAEPVLTSYYGTELAGNPTASGEPFDPYGLTAAHPSLPFGTLLRVTNNGRSVTVRVNDRGPFVPGRGLDLSLGAAQAIGLTDAGPAVVEVEDGETPEANSPAPESETAESASPTSDHSSAEGVPSTEMLETGEHHFYKAGVSYETSSSPEASLAPRLVEARPEQVELTLYRRPRVLRRRSGELNEDIV